MISVSRNLESSDTDAAHPKTDQSILQRLASVDINQTDIQLGLNARLSFSHILSQDLASRKVVRSLCGLGKKQAGVILQEIVIWRLRMDRVVGRVSLRSQITLSLEVALSLHHAYFVGTSFRFGRSGGQKTCIRCWMRSRMSYRKDVRVARAGAVESGSVPCAALKSKQEAATQRNFVLTMIAR